MNILVCFKVIPDLDMLSVKDWQVGDTLRVGTGYVRSILNCYDESALELALKLSDLSEGFGACPSLSALTVGDERAESYLKTLYALRYGRAIHVTPDKDISFSPNLIADAITSFTIQNPQDVLLLGAQSPEGDNGKVPLLVAEQLGWPCITQVISIARSEKNSLLVESAVDGGFLTQLVKTPVVLVVGDCPNACLRVPTLRDRMQYGKREIERLPLSALLSGQTQPNGVLIDLKPIDHTRSTVVISEGSPQEKAERLFHLAVKEHLQT